MCKWVQIRGFRVPESFWKILDYPGQSRFVMLYWTPFGDETVFDDGVMSVCGADWQAFLFLLADPWNELGLKRACRMLKVQKDAIGSSDQEATHAIVVDREGHKSYLIPIREAHTVVVSQHKTTDVEVTAFISPEDWDGIVRAIADVFERFPEPSVEEIEEEIREQRKAMAEFVADMHKAPPNCTHIINGWGCTVDGSTCPGQCDGFEPFRKYDMDGCYRLMTAFAERCHDDGDLDAIRDLKDLLGINDD